MTASEARLVARATGGDADAVATLIGEIRPA